MIDRKEKVVAIVQARMSSKRLPGKVMADLCGRPLIAWVLDRVSKAEGVDAVWLATSDRLENDGLASYVMQLGYEVFRGSEEDVLLRFSETARRASADIIVRITADCPFIDPGIIRDVLNLRVKMKVDYATNTIDRKFPDGLDVEVFTRAALERAQSEASDAILREHVTPYISGKRRDVLPWGGFSTAQLLAPGEFGHLRWTVDELEDLEFVRAVADALGRDNFSWLDVVALLTRKPELMRMNARFVVNEGSAIQLASLNRRFDRSNQLLARALENIPLATQTFSKSYYQWVKGATPLFIERGRGCYIWDIDGNSYIDHVLGLLPVILGYADPDVDAAIIQQLGKGIVFSLASPLEIDLADRLIDTIPCAEMVRLAKNGSDATTAAIRLARAHTGRDKVLVSGYHGWHDWYIGTTARDQGVPAAVKALSSTFPFNDADALEKTLIADPDGIAAVILEPAGASAPAPGFLNRIRELTSRFGVVLIFDEIITGFRIHLGGAQAYYGVTPDLATFGKSMANGMPISALVGKREIMAKMTDVFVSGTFGGETLSIAAAIATIDKLQKENVVDRLWRRGKALTDGSNAIFERRGFGDILMFAGDGWWPRLSITKPPVDANLMTSLLRQEFVAEGLLLASSFNLCLSHDSDRIMGETLAAFDRAITNVRQHLESPDPSVCLRGERVKSTFAVR